MMRALLLAALLASSAQCALAQTLVSPQADAQSTTLVQGSASSAVLYGFAGGTVLNMIRAGIVIDGLAATGMLTIQNYGYNGATWDRVRSGAAADTSSSIANTGVAKQQSFIYNGSAGNLVPLSSSGSSADASAAANQMAAGISGFNGTTWDRVRVFGSVANVGTGVPRVQIEAGYSSVLNMTAATQVKASAGRAFKISVVTAGAVGQLCDTATACAAANVVATIPAAVGVYDVNWPFATGIRYEPGAAQVSAITFQ